MFLDVARASHRLDAKENRSPLFSDTVFGGMDHGRLREISRSHPKGFGGGERHALAIVLGLRAGRGDRCFVPLYWRARGLNRGLLRLR